MQIARAATSLAVVLVAHAARAADCAPPEILDMFPPDGATNVPTNAILSAHYSPSSQWVGGEHEVVTLHGPDPGGEDIPVDPLPDCTPPEGMDRFPPGNYCWSGSEGLLKLRPPEDLRAGSAYTVEWPGLRGLTASRGAGRTVTFTVGDGPDVESPKFAGLENVEWDVGRSKDECIDSEADRFLFDLTPGEASDDFGTESLALVVYETRGPNIGPSSPPEQVAFLPFPVKRDPTRIELSLDDGKGPVCFAARAQDLIGNSSTGADKQVCATTKKPPFFYGCAMTAPRFATTTAAPALLLLLSLAALRRHRSPS